MDPDPHYRVPGIRVLGLVSDSINSAKRNFGFLNKMIWYLWESVVSKYYYY